MHHEFRTAHFNGIRTGPRTVTATAAAVAAAVASFTLASIATAGGAPSEDCPTAWIPLVVGGPPNVGIVSLDVVKGESADRLYVHGAFTELGGVRSRYLASISAAGVRAESAAPSSLAFRILNFDDGSGPILHLVGGFTMLGEVSAERIARWVPSATGGQWEEVGGGLNNLARCATTADLGADCSDDQALFVGGHFTMAGEVPVVRIARWDGATWSALGEGLNDRPNALVATGSGTTLAGERRARDASAGCGGSSLYAAGKFTASGETPLGYVGRWDGSAWSPLGSGVDGEVHDALIADLGDGVRLYVTGEFTSAGELPVSHIASWDGGAWSALGEGLGAPGRDLAVVDFGQGPRLMVTRASAAEGAVTAGLLQWDGTTWSTVVDTGMTDIAAIDFGAGPSLVAAGNFTSIGGQPIARLARFDGIEWSPMLDERRGVEVDFNVWASLVRLEEEHAVAYLGGYRIIDSVFYGCAARVIGLSRPSAHEGTVEILGTLPAGRIFTLIEHDSGTGSAVHAVGRFVDAATGVVSGLARWDEGTWTILPSVLGASSIDMIGAATFDDGSGPALYVGGRFSSVEGVPAQNVARWRNGLWEAVGEGVSYGVASLHVHQDGAWPVLHAGLIYTAGGAVGQVGVLRWNGAEWEAPGLDNASSQAHLGTVYAMATHDDGTGTALYATRDGPPGTHLLWRLDDDVWKPIGGPFPLGEGRSLISHDDGDGAMLYVGGTLGTYLTPTVKVGGLYRWDGKELLLVGAGVPPASSSLSYAGIYTMASIPRASHGNDHADAAGRCGAILVAGEFMGALEKVSTGFSAGNIALLGNGRAPIIVDQPCDAVVVEGETVHFSVELFGSALLGDLVLRWRKDDVELEDGPGAGGTIGGASTPVLSISGVTAADVGLYDVVVENECGVATSSTASLQLTCVEDVDGDGAVDGADLGALLAAWGSTDAASDLNDDGVVDAADLALLIGAWGCVAR